MQQSQNIIGLRPLVSERWESSGPEPSRFSFSNCREIHRHIAGSIKSNYTLEHAAGQTLAATGDIDTTPAAGRTAATKGPCRKLFDAKVSKLEEREWPC
jgi:hypothetical protein